MSSQTIYTVRSDGDMWFASTDDFVNLQESEVAFAKTPEGALTAFIERKRQLQGTDLRAAGPDDTTVVGASPAGGKETSR